MISIKNLQKVYSNGVQAIRGIDLTVKEQFVHALLGPNGAGKTSTIKSILGLIKFEGEIKVLGENIDKVRDRIAFVPEEKSFYDYLTPRSSVNMCKRLFKNFDEKEAYRLLEYFEIPLNKKIKSFSNGMKTSVYLTLALAQDVDLYIFDEPTTGLDPIKRSNLLELLRQKVIDGKTILYSSHIIPEVEKIADYVSIMYKGKILYSGFTDEIKEKFKVIYIPVDTLSKLEINLQNFFSVMQENEVVLLLSNEEKQWEEMMEIEDAEVKDVNLEEFFNVLIRGYDNVY
ncbi:MAG: type transport system ATP-binding protein [Thermotogaceae bacterium]|nr:type transport system ATP-binding protein [Thermotogaceae bacterium]MDN5337296.1 type transport system ATP-binding protein [Thermotogaceae bacterium]